MAEPAVAPRTSLEHLGMRSAPIAILAAAAVIVVLHEGKTLFAPVLGSVLLAYALEPFVAGLVRLRLPRIVAAVLIYAALAAASAGVTGVARGQVMGFLDDLPKTLASVRRAIVRDRDRADQPTAMGQVQQAVKDLQATVEGAAVAPASRPGVPRVIPVQRRFTLRDYLKDAGLGFVGAGSRFFLIALLTFLLLVAGDLFKRKFLRLAGPRRAERQRVLDVIMAINRQVERYLMVREG